MLLYRGGSEGEVTGVMSCCCCCCCVLASVRSCVPACDALRCVALCCVLLRSVLLSIRRGYEPDLITITHNIHPTHSFTFNLTTHLTSSRLIPRHFLLILSFLYHSPPSMLALFFFFSSSLLFSSLLFSSLSFPSEEMEDFESFLKLSRTNEAQANEEFGGEARKEKVPTKEKKEQRYQERHDKYKQRMKDRKRRKKEEKRSEGDIIKGSSSSRILSYLLYYSFVYIFVIAFRKLIFFFSISYMRR